MFESAGMLTVVIAVRAFKDLLAAMKVPRALITPELMGRPLGLPGDLARQRAALEAGLNLMEEAETGGSIVEL